MKVFLILDGIGDLPCKTLKGKTPLEAAKTPNLDALSKKANFGYAYTVGKKIAPESDIAVTALLGYDPYKFYTGRGPLEAYGAGVKLREGNLALRTNFSTADKNMNLIDRRVGRALTTKEAEVLAHAVNKNVKLSSGFEFVATSQHRGVLVLKGKLSANINNVDPAYAKVGTFGVARSQISKKILDCIPFDKKKETIRSAELVNEFVRKSREVLDKHPVNKKRKKKGLLPANIIVPRDGGIGLPKFKKKKGWAAVVSMPLEIGIARQAGMKILKFNYPKITSTDIYSFLYKGMDATIKASKKALKEGKYKTYYLHIKETDIPGHDGRAKDKKKMIEILDKKLFSFIRKIDCELILTGDHSTPCKMKGHSADPVPLMWIGKPKKDNVMRFTEKESRKGSLGAMMGKDILKKTGF